LFSSSLQVRQWLAGKVPKKLIRERLADAYIHNHWRRLVWPENWQAVKVFCGAVWTYRNDGIQATAVSISFQEIESGARLMGVPTAEWPQLLSDVQLMVHTTIELRAKEG
jgi:hypothetical protein